jgi:hypothetical protein
MRGFTTAEKFYLGLAVPSLDLSAIPADETEARFQARASLLGYGPGDLAERSENQYESLKNLNALMCVLGAIPASQEELKGYIH